MTDRRGDEGWARGQKYFALGLKFAGGVMVFLGIGYGLDRWLGSIPIFTLLGTFAGVALSFLSVYRDLMSDEAAQRRPPGGKP